MLTWPRQLTLSRFDSALTSLAPGYYKAGKVCAFDPKKEPSTLRTNLRYWKQFIAYYYHVAYRGSYFTLPTNKSKCPKD